MLLTLLFLIFGWLTAIPFVVELSRVSGLLTAVTITAFVGSFIYAFAELGNNEAWQKAILLHAPEFMLGLYIPVAWHEAQSAGILILAAAGVVHVAIWKASVHSRGFRTRILQISKLMEEKENWQKLYFVLWKHLPIRIRGTGCWKTKQNNLVVKNLLIFYSFE